MSNITENLKFPFGTIVRTEEGELAQVIHTFVNPSHKMDNLCVLETKEPYKCSFYDAVEVGDGEVNRFVYREDMLTKIIP